MSQTTPSNPLLTHAPSAAASETMDYMGEDSVYIEPDQKISQSILDETFIQDNDINASPNDQSSLRDDSNPKRKRREERQLRLAAEQTSRLREKFDLPSTEQLIGSFSAALFRTILLQGRMYITTRHICFYTKLFGKVTKEAFSFVSMSRVKKRRGGLVANAIKIYFSSKDTAPVIIGSLNHREKAFGIIQERLRLLNPIAAEPRQTDDDGSAGSIGSAPNDSEVPLDGRDYIEPLAQLNASSTDASLTNRRNSNENVTELAPADELNGQNFHSSSAPSSHNSDTFVNGNRNLDDWETSLLWCTPDDVVGQVAAKSYEKRSERARGVLNTSVKEAFNLLYASDWLKEYHGAVNNQEVVINEWFRDTDSYMCRTVTFRRPLGFKFGPKETRVNETQRYSFSEQGAVIVEVQGENLDVPYGNYFRVESFFELSPLGDGGQTLFILSVAVNFLKSSMLQGKIESATLSETKVAYERLVQLAINRVDTYAAERNTSRALTNGIGNQQTSSRSKLEGTELSATTKSSKRLPSNQGRVVNRMVTEEVAAVNYQSPKKPSAATLVREEKRSGRTDEMLPGVTVGRSTNNIVEVHDSSETYWLRIAALGLLAVTCTLLIVIIALLNRVHGLVKTLEKVLDNTGQMKQVGGQC